MKWIIIFILLIIVAIIVYSYFYRDLDKYMGFYSNDDVYPTHNKCDYNSTVQRGLKHMKEQNVVICGLVRDVQPQMNDIIKKVEHIGSKFKSYKVLIVENDSNDKTREALLKWKELNNDVIILGCGINSKKCELRLPMYELYSSKPARIKKMAYLRNLYLDLVKKYFRTYDYMLAIDLDIVGSFYTDGIANSFDHLKDNPKIDALCANGIDIYLEKYYDPFAFIEDGKDIEYSSQKEKLAHDKYIMNKIKFGKCDPLYKVSSCFGGLAVYRIGSILGQSYDYPKNGKLGCEHNYFHKDLNMYLNPSMIYSVLKH